MERYNLCSNHQKEILDKLFWYLGFNEVTSFEKYIDFMFLNAKYGVTFENTVNHTIKHIVLSFWESFPEYKENNYIKYFWLKQENMINHMTAGSNIELDPKGLLRHFVKENFIKLLSTKL